MSANPSPDNREDRWQEDPALPPVPGEEELDRPAPRLQEYDTLNISLTSPKGLASKLQALLKAKELVLPRYLYPFTDQVLKDTEPFRPTSIICEGSSATFVTNFIHECLKAKDPSISLPNHRLDPSGSCFRAPRDELFQQQCNQMRDEIGERPLIVSEFVNRGRQMGRTIDALKEGRALTYASMFTMAVEPEQCAYDRTQNEIRTVFGTELQRQDFYHQRGQAFPLHTVHRAPELNGFDPSGSWVTVLFATLHVVEEFQDEMAKHSRELLNRLLEGYQEYNGGEWRPSTGGIARFMLRHGMRPEHYIERNRWERLMHKSFPSYTTPQLEF